MDSDAFTNTPTNPSRAADPHTVEYILYPEDHLALSLFIYDKAHPPRRGGAVFLVGRFLFLASVFAAFAYALAVRVPARREWEAPVAAVLLTLTPVWILDTFWPGGLFRSFFRGVHRRRIARIIESGRRRGLFNPTRRDRVVLAEEGFIEMNDLLDDLAAGVEINDHKETRVAWSAVAGIDVTPDHAFFTVTDRGYLILPRDIFADPESFQQFVDTARQLREAARLAPVSARNVARPQDTRITR